MRDVFRFLARIAAVRLVAMGLLMATALAGVELFHFAFGVRRLAPGLDFAAMLALCAAMTGLYAVLVRLFERRWPRELALGKGVGWAALGIAIGFGLFCSVYAIFTAMGLVDWGGFRGLVGVGPMLLVAAVSGVGEELVFRGVIFRVLEDSLGTALAIALSAALFGLMHMANPGATPVSTIAIALEAGAMLAAAYAWSRSLWLPIGLHFAWNFTEGGVFGAAVSGGHASGLFAVTLSRTASPLITGGAFGPEASLVAVAACLCLAILFLILAARAGHWRRRAFRMMLAR